MDNDTVHCPIVDDDVPACYCECENCEGEDFDCENCAIFLTSL